MCRSKPKPKPIQKSSKPVIASPNPGPTLVVIGIPLLIFLIAACGVHSMKEKPVSNYSEPVCLKYRDCHEVKSTPHVNDPYSHCRYEGCTRLRMWWGKCYWLEDAPPVWLGEEDNITYGNGMDYPHWLAWYKRKWHHPYRNVPSTDC